MPTVYLVGAGPGDPGLITVRGRDLLARADAVVYDALANEAFLRYAPHADHIFVGKQPGRHALLQKDINRILIEQAAKHACVVRLKGGDPFVFGRGGEEALALSEHGIKFEIVPGVTAGIAAPAYAGIPATHRGTALGAVLLSGHLAPDAPEALALDAFPAEVTLIFYMPVKNLAATAAALINPNRPADTPAALIRNGTLPTQKVISGTLGEFAANKFVDTAASPAVFIVGEAAALRDELQWFESRPLHGRRVVVTRTLERAGDLVDRLGEFGAEVFEFPTVEISPVALRDDADVAAQYDWVVFTSVNAVESLFDRLFQEGKDARSLSGVKFCAVGTRTMAEMHARSLVLDAQPDDFEPASVADALESAGGSLRDMKILLPRADIARSALREELEGRGAQVTERRTYRAAAPRTAAALADEVVEFAPDYITFLSASAARNFAAVMGPDRIAAIRERAVAAAIGPIAAHAAREIGLNAAVVPEVHRIPALVDALAAYDAHPS